MGTPKIKHAKMGTPKIKHAKNGHADNEARQARRARNLAHSIMVVENFEIRLSETPQNGSILLHFCHIHTFTMVEENFEMRLSERLQNDSILPIS